MESGSVGKSDPPIYHRYYFLKGRMADLVLKMEGIFRAAHIQNPLSAVYIHFAHKHKPFLHAWTTSAGFQGPYKVSRHTIWHGKWEWNSAKVP